MLKQISRCWVGIWVLVSGTTGFCADERPPPEVFATQVIRMPMSDPVEALGTLSANERVNITAVVTEQVTKIHFEDNQYVEQGVVLVELNAQEERAQRVEQTAILEEYQRQLRRLVPLVEKGAAPQSALDEARQNVATTQARLDAINSLIELRVIRAPFSGVLGLRNISLGALVQPSTLITTLDDLRVMKLDFTVPEVFLSSLALGLEIEAEADAFGDTSFTGTVTSIDSRVDPISRSIIARARLDNDKGLLRPGLLMRVTLFKNQRQALVILEESISLEAGQNWVYALTQASGDWIARRQNIRVGARYDGRAEVLNGLAEGDYVVAHGQLKVRPGQSVRIKAMDSGEQTLRQLLESATE